MSESLAPVVSVEWLANHLDHPNLIILDATLNKAGGVVPAIDKNLRIRNARFFDIKKAFSDSNSEFPNTLPGPLQFERAARQLGINKDSLIVVYDAWGIYSSARAWWMFKIMGHDQVAVLNGGLPAWQEKGYPCTTENLSTAESGNFQATFRPEWVKHTKDIVDNLKSQDHLVIDARSKGRFEATSPEPRAGLRGGHIPGSKSLPYAEVLEHNKIKSVEDLKSIFNQLNLDNRSIICSCGSGITAAVIYLAAYIAGQQDLALYDGSWTEYAQQLNLPVEK
jgi:thiosulfate/3-mercaptopyruvate sulfurtransferase